MPDGRILFTDLDGTLLTDDRMVSEGNRRAIADALERGNYIAAATGRAWADAAGLLYDCV